MNSIAIFSIDQEKCRFDLRDRPAFL